MRKHAKHRLIGASVLVLVGIVGFPLLFDTQPRPVAVDIPIEIPGKNAIKPPVVSVAPAAPPAPAPAASSEKVNAAASLSPQEEIYSPKPSPAVAVVAPPAIKKEVTPESRQETKTEVKPEVPTEGKLVAKPVVKAETKPSQRPAPANDDGARAIALLNGTAVSQTPKAAAAARSTTEEPKPAAAVAEETKTRMVVQVGAFADAAKADEIRRKLEKAGLKTYTQVADTKDGKRIRVRVGPFASKAEAEKAVGKIRSLDLPVAILSF